MATVTSGNTYATCCFCRTVARYMPKVTYLDRDGDVTDFACYSCYTSLYREGLAISLVEE